jgi:hypothetical protein
MKTWMRLGAAVRVRELDAEVALIRSEFPDLGRANTPASSVEPATKPRRRRRFRMSPEARKRQSERMKKLWAKRTAANKAASKATKK